MRGVPLARFVRLLVTGLVVLLVMTACSSSADETLPELDSTSSSSSSTSTTTTTTTAPSNTEPDNTADDPQVAAIKAVWTEFVRVGADRSDPDRVAELSTADVPALADDQFFDPRDAQSFYTQVTIDGETATIEDCSFFSQPLSEFFFVPLNGQATRGEDGEWKISNLAVLSLETCIPGDLAGEVYAAYETFWDAELIYANPPDTSHPLVEQSLTGRRLERMGEVLAWQVENDAAWRGRPETSPEFRTFRPGQSVIQDCQVPNPESGYYDLESGEKLPGQDEIFEGQRDSVRTNMEFVDEQWKVEFVGATRDADCEFAPTDIGIRIVGPIPEVE